jgi:hypothetical protein
VGSHRPKLPAFDRFIIVTIDCAHPSNAPHLSVFKLGTRYVIASAVFFFILLATISLMNLKMHDYADRTTLAIHTDDCRT